MKRTAVYVGNDRVLLRTANGYKMFVDARDVSIAPHLILEGIYERHTDAVLRTMIRPGMRILDIGANVGLFTVLMAHRTGRRGRVLSFECDPMLAQMSRDNLEINGLGDRATIDERAVSDCIRSMRFYSADRHRGGGTLISGLEQLPGMASERREIEVQTTTVDEIMQDHPEGFDFVKIDAEGAETSIFRGGKTLFADRVRPLRIMTEFAPPFISRAGDDPARHLDELETYGFTPQLIDERRARVVPVSRDQLLSRPFSDILLTRT